MIDPKIQKLASSMIVFVLFILALALLMEVLG